MAYNLFFPTLPFEGYRLMNLEDINKKMYPLLHFTLDK